MYSAVYLSAVALVWPSLVAGGAIFPLQQGFRIDFLMLSGYACVCCPNSVPKGNLK